MSTTPSSSPPSPPPRSESGDAALDLTGEVCPYTFVQVRLALEAMPVGATLRVEFDHPPAARNLPRSLAAWGQQVSAVEPAGPGRWRLAVTKRVA
ncbi:MAG: sulfurtransferase TusA family protein [Kofleriaceae bacterium]